MAKVRLLIAEDSTFQRNMLSKMLSEHEKIEICGLARNGKEAIEKVAEHNPDVLLLDLIMPEMDGLTAFKFLSKHYPVPTIIFTGMDPATLDSSVQALLLGAVDYIVKPKGIWKEEFPKYKDKLIDKIIIASNIKKSSTKRRELLTTSIENYLKEFPPEKPVPAKKAEKVIPKKIPKVKPKVKPKKIPKVKPKEIPKVKPREIGIEFKRFKPKVIVIGTSTGGPRVLRTVLKDIPRTFPIPILIVQHLEEQFMRTFANSLNNLCEIKVKIAQNKERILPNKVYLAPGANHMEVYGINKEPHLRIFKGDPVNFCRPSVDVLFFSAAKIYKNALLGILLTGLGNDGAAGLKAIKTNGGLTIAESEETCVIYGMPKAAIKIDAARLVLPIYQVRSHILKYAK